MFARRVFALLPAGFEERLCCERHRWEKKRVRVMGSPNFFGTAAHGSPSDLNPAMIGPEFFQP